MATQQAIQNLINNSRQLVTRQKVINNDLADMEVAYTKQNIELANLGAKSAIDAIGKFKKLQMDNLESEATNDFYENQYKNYLNSPEVDEASDVLKTSSDSGTLMHSSFNDLYNKEGVPAYVISKAAEKHPMYGYTYAKLEVGKIAGKFEGYVSSAMAKSQTILTLPDQINPITGRPHTFKISEANTLQEKLAAHRYLRGKWFTDNGIGKYGQAFLSLPEDKYGSGFYQKIDAAENGKNGMFARYEVQAAIYDSNQRIALATEAAVSSPSPASLQHLLDTYMIGISDKGVKFSKEQAHKKFDDFMIAGIKAGTVKYEHLKTWSDSIVPGSESKKHPKGRTRGEVWPNRMGYKDGKFGSYFREWQKDLHLKQSDKEKAAKAGFKQELPGAIERIKTAQSSKGAYDVIFELKNKFGTGEGMDYTSLYDAIDNRGTGQADLTLEKRALIEYSKTGPIDNLISDALRDSNDPEIAHILHQEKTRRESGTGAFSYESQLNGVTELLTGDLKTTLGLPDTSGLNMDQKLVLEKLHSVFDTHVQNGESALNAYGLTVDWAKKNGFGSHNLTQEMVDADPNIDTRMLSLTGAGGTLMDRSIIDGTRYSKPTFNYKESVATINSNITNGVGPDTAVGQLSATVKDPNSLKNGFPVIMLEGENSKESADYNTILSTNGNIRQSLIDVAKATNTPLAEVVEARSIAWGNGPLKPEIKEMLGADSLKGLSKAEVKRVVDHDDGVFNDTSAKIAKEHSDDPTFIIDRTGLMELSAGSLLEGEEQNTVAAYYESVLGGEAYWDFAAGGKQQLADAIENQWIENIQFVETLKNDPTWSTNMWQYTGNAEWLKGALLPEFKE